MDLGNLVSVALVFGQLVSGRQLALDLFAAGIVISVACYIISYEISKYDRR